MPSGKPRPATPQQIARNGHVAALLRQHMNTHNLSPVELAAALGLKGSHVGQIYKWIGAKASPGPMFRPRMAKLLGVGQDDLKFREAAPKLPVPYQQQMINPLVARKASADVLTFNVDSDGEARLRLDVKLPLEKGTALLRIVLDAGVLMSAPEEAPA